MKETLSWGIYDEWLLLNKRITQVDVNLLARYNLAGYLNDFTVFFRVYFFEISYIKFVISYENLFVLSTNPYNYLPNKFCRKEQSFYTFCIFLCILKCQSLLFHPENVAFFHQDLSSKPLKTVNDIPLFHTCIYTHTYQIHKMKNE